MNKIFFIILVFISKLCYSQKSSQNIPIRDHVDTNFIKTIDKEKLTALISESSAIFHVVVIYTSLCGGTPYMLNRVNNIKREFGEQVNVILCSSDPNDELKLIVNTLKQHSLEFSPTYLIDGEKYRENKADHRKKGLRFRNDICKECKKIIIGVPFLILYDKNGSIVSKGFLKNEELEDKIALTLRPGSKE